MEVRIRRYRDGKRISAFVITSKRTWVIKIINFDDFYFGYSDYRFRFLIRVFGKDILCFNIFGFKRKLRRFLRLFGIMGIVKLKRLWIIFFKKSIWKVGFDE